MSGYLSEKTKSRSLDVMSKIRKFTVKEVVKCSAYALIFAMARVNSDPKY